MIYFFFFFDDLLEKYNTIWDQVKKEFDSETVYNKNYSKNKIKSQAG